MEFYTINLLVAEFMRPDTATTISLKAKFMLDLAHISSLYDTKSITGLKNSVI